MPCGSSKESGNHEENGHCAFEDLDHSVLQQPLNLGVTNVKQILKCIQSGSKEIKDIILNECNVIYECKACGGLFRSLANFMYHKRCYCKKHMCEDMVLFENFEEEEDIVVLNPEVPMQNSEKTSDNKPDLSKLVDCTVKLEKSDIVGRMESSSKAKADAPTTSKVKNVASAGDKAKAKPVPEKTESSMISRRTRNKNAPVKIVSEEEPPIKCAKIISARIMRKTSSEKSTAGAKKESLPASASKDGKSKKITISKFPVTINKTNPAFPKVVFKAIDSNPHAVYQSNEKKKLSTLGVNSNSSVQTKIDKDKLIIVLKKDTKSDDSSPTKSSEKSKSEMERLSDFHMTRRKRLMSRNDCNVHELRCLTCKTQFMSLKTLYFHMLSLHSKKRLYYPCPFCKTLFVQMYGVTRHLISIHNKTKEQINKMRDVIKKKSVWKRIDDVNPVNDNSISPLNYQIQAQHQEEEKEVPKPVESVVAEQKKDSNSSQSVIRLGKNVTLHQCSKCGRVFGRKSSQVSHEKFCIMNTTIKKEDVDEPPPSSSEPSPTPTSPMVSFISIPQKQTTQKPTCVLQITKTKSENIPLNKPTFEVARNLFDVKLSRPKRGAKKQMHKDFVNSQTLKWRSANRVDTSVNKNKEHSAPVTKKPNGKNLEKKVHSFMNPEDLTCLKCNKTFSSYSNLRRHVAIHVGWTRFKCKYCDYQAYNKSQCWAHVQKTHNIDDDDMEKCIVHLANCSPGKKGVQQNTSFLKINVDVSAKSIKANSLSKVKISKKKHAKHTGSQKNQTQFLKKEHSEPKEEGKVLEIKKENIQQVIPIVKFAKKETADTKKDQPQATITITKLSNKGDPDNKDKPQAMITIQKFPKKENLDGKKEKPQHIIPLQKLTVPDYKKDANYKSVTTSNPTTIILSKKIPSSTVQSIVTISPDSMSSPTKISSIRSSPRKSDGKEPGDKLITTLVTRSPGNTKITPIQIKLQARKNSMDEIQQDSSDQNCPKKERLISEWFPKKDMSTTTTIRRDSAPLIIGLVPASNSGVNARPKNSVIATEKKNP